MGDTLRKPKTWKRECAAVAGLFWAGITARLFWMDDPVLVQAFAAAYGTVTFCTFTLIGAMFGIHFYGVRTPPGGTA